MMATHYAAYKIRVNCICPGSDENAVWSTPRPRNGSNITRRVCLSDESASRKTSPAALYLASDEGSMVTAAILPVDGGMRLTGR